MNEALRPIPFGAADAPARLTQDLREIGFAVLEGAPLDHAAIDRIYDLSLIHI